MNVFDALKERKSVRSFLKKDVDDRLVGLILYMATQAPSAGNTQDWQFVVVRERERKKKLAAAALQQKFIEEAPVVIVVCSDLEKVSLRYGKKGETVYAFEDAAAAAMSIMLAARGLDIDSCWVGAFDEEAVSHIIEMPENIRPMMIIPVGYAAEEARKPDRIPFENLTSSERYGKKFTLSAVQPFAKHDEELAEPLSVYFEEFFKKIEDRRQPEAKKKLTFAEFLKRLTK